MTKIALLATHDLGVDCLRHLDAEDDASIEVVVAYPPDHDHWWDGSVYETARELGHDVLTVDEEDRLLDIPVDWILSVYYPNILGPDLLDHPHEGALNLHQAELPRYRGSNVFAHAIMNARPDDHWHYGTTIHFMVEEVDAGDVVDRRFVEIRETDTARSLYNRTRSASLELFEDTLPKIVSGSVHGMRTPPEEFDGERYYHRKDSLDDLFHVTREELATGDPTAIYDRIRALQFPPLDPAYTTLDGRQVGLTIDAPHSPEQPE